MGWMHAFTVTSIITGLKPVINVVYLLVFLLAHGRHRRLLRTLNKVDAEYAAAFNCLRSKIVFISGAVSFPYGGTIITRGRLGEQVSDAAVTATVGMTED